MRVRGLRGATSRLCQSLRSRTWELSSQTVRRNPLRHFIASLPSEALADYYLCPGKPLDLRPQFLEAFLPHQFLKLTAIAEIGVQFLRDQSAQRVEAILTAGMPVAFCFQKLLGSQSPRLPLLALGDHRLASVLEPLDPGSQRVTFLLQFIDPPGQVSAGSGWSAMLSSVFGLLAAIGFRRGR